METVKLFGAHQTSIFSYVICCKVFKYRIVDNLLL